MTEPWNIQLFGPLRAKQDDRTISRFRSQQTGELLAYLAYHRHRSHGREALVELFWPDSAPEAGSHNLSNALSSLRSQLEPPGVPGGAVVLTDRSSIELNPEAVVTDVDRFQAALRRAAQGRNSADYASLLAHAADIYGGPLLPFLYNDWIAPEQAHLQQRYQDTVSQLVNLLEKDGRYDTALTYAERAVTLDPLHEAAHRDVMRLLSAVGRHQAALVQFRELERVLADELAASPSSVTVQLVRRIEERFADAGAVSVSAPSAPRPSGSGAARELPTGTVTFLLASVAGTTDLLDGRADAFNSALAVYHAVMRSEMRRAGGVEVQVAKDSFIAAFQSATDALSCAVSCRRALAAQPLPLELGVRIALHTGDVELEYGKYQDGALRDGAAMLDAAHGGQTLASEATAALVRRDLEPGTRLTDLGLWRLREADGPERIFELDYPNREVSEFPPLNAAQSRAARLPLQFTRFFGRTEEVQNISDLLQATNTRLLTLTGPGGSGKTRLAIEAAGLFAETFQGSIWFVSLADISDPSLILGAILDALGIARSATSDPREQVVAALSKQPSLLLVDNFEQLVEGGAEIVKSLLEGVPGLTVLATSRRTLGIPGEQELTVAPLPTPSVMHPAAARMRGVQGGASGSHGTEKEHEWTPDSLSAFHSVQLFVDRAQASKPDFRVSNQNAAAVAELCDRLEGLPLAIELAAARAQAMTPSQMLAHLSRRFEFLVSRKRGLAERQRTMRAAIDWSYRLLTPELQTFFCRLSVFRGGWTVEAAEAVCDEPLALDHLALLRECSLVFTDDTGPEMRFRMLETLREYGEEQLSGEEREEVGKLHWEYFLALAEEARPLVQGPDEVLWLDRLEADHDNIRAALNLLREAPDGGEVGLQIGLATHKLWLVRGYWSEGLRRLYTALAHAGAQTRTQLRADALNAAGVIALNLNQYMNARDMYVQGLAIRREIGDLVGVAGSLNNLGNLDRIAADFESARVFFEESLSLSQNLGDLLTECACLHNLALLAAEEGDSLSASNLYEKSLEIVRVVGAVSDVALVLTCLGHAYFRSGELARARQCADEALALERSSRDMFHLAQTLQLHGILYAQETDWAAAETCLVESLRLCRDVGDLSGVSDGLAVFADLCFARGELSRTALTLGAVDALRTSIGFARTPWDLQEHERRLAELRTALGESALERAWEVGRAMSWEQAVAEALGEANPE